MLGRGLLQVTARHAVWIVLHQDFESARLAGPRCKLRISLEAGGFLGAYGDPPGHDLAGGVFQFPVIGLVHGPLDDRAIVAEVGQDAEFEAFRPG